jgi:hypothetical protein
MTKPDPQFALQQSDGTPIAYRTLTLYAQLETVELEDAERFEAVNALVLDWIGSELRWSLASGEGHVNPFRPQVLEYPVVYPEDLSFDPQGENLELGYILMAGARDDFLVFCHGAEVNNYASPFDVRYLFQIAPPPPGGSDRLKTKGFFRISVPFDSDQAVFMERVDQITRLLRVRWASAGYSYTGWDVRWKKAIRTAAYAHGRRFPGYDVGIYAGLQDEWHDQVRSVNWLTYLGPEFAERAGGLAQLSGISRRSLDVSAWGSMVRLRAGASPAEGNHNRLIYPAEYAAVDHAIRAVRAKGVEFEEPFTANTSDDWLRRFERVVPQA